VLIKTFFAGLETRRSQLEEFGGVNIAYQIVVLHNGAPGIEIHVTGVSPVVNVPDGTFDLRGHEWKRAFTDEVR
jgi:hypothetical protein